MGIRAAFSLSFVRNFMELDQERFRNRNVLKCVPEEVL
jgi:hypothetical protein